MRWNALGNGAFGWNWNTCLVINEVHSLEIKCVIANNPLFFFLNFVSILRWRMWWRIRVLLYLWVFLLECKLTPRCRWSCNGLSGRIYSSEWREINLSFVTWWTEIYCLETSTQTTENRLRQKQGHVLKDSSYNMEQRRIVVIICWTDNMCKVQPLY